MDYELILFGVSGNELDIPFILEHLEVDFRKVGQLIKHFCRLFSLSIIDLILLILLRHYLRCDKARVSLVHNNAPHGNVKSVHQCSIIPDHIINVFHILQVIHGHLSEGAVTYVHLILHIFQLYQAQFDLYVFNIGVSDPVGSIFLYPQLDVLISL
jgi:hypothetical protein